MSDRPEPNVRLTVSIDLAWPDLETEENVPGNVHLTDACHDAVAGAVHAVLEAGDPDDTYNMVIVVEDSSVLQEES